MEYYIIHFNMLRTSLANMTHKSNFQVERDELCTECISTHESILWSFYPLVVKCFDLHYCPQLQLCSTYQLKSFTDFMLFHNSYCVKGKECSNAEAKTWKEKRMPADVIRPALFKILKNVTFANVLSFQHAVKASRKQTLCFCTDSKYVFTRKLHRWHIIAKKCICEPINLFLCREM